MAGTYGGPMFKDSNEWKRGEQGEKVAREWLISERYSVIPTSLIETGGAPVLLQYINANVDRTALILPDNLVFRHGNPRWVEVKTKSRCTYNNSRKRWEHGMPLRHWKAYLKVQEETNIKGALAIVQLDERLLLTGSFDDVSVGACEYLGTNMPGGEPHIFFHVDRFERWDLDRLSPLVPAPESPKVVRPWEEGRKFPGTRQAPLPGF